MGEVKWYKLSACKRGYDRRWRKARELYLRQPGNELCKICLRSGVVKESEVVDHIVPHRGDKRLFWDRSNWQPLCALCNNQKQAEEYERSGCNHDGSPVDPSHPWHQSNIGNITVSLCKQRG